MGITIRNATTKTIVTRTARIHDGAAKGLTVLHLREFLRAVDEVGGIGDDVRVSLRDDMQSSSSWRTIDISAAVKEYPDDQDQPIDE